MKRLSEEKRAKEESKGEAESKIKSKMKSKIIEFRKFQNLASYLFIIFSLLLIFSFSCAKKKKQTKEVKEGESVCVPSEEVCDGLDNDCNGLIDDGVELVFYKDLDGDGYTDGTTSVGCSAPEGYVLSALLGDCNDEDNQINPGKTEICDGIDNNCDGQIDEGVKLVFYKDLDGDGYTDGTTEVGCSAPTGYVLSALPGDCDEGDAQRNPGVTERCDAVDNDCDGQVDEGCACIDGQMRACYTGPSGTEGVGECRAGMQVCSNGVWGPCVGEVTPQPEVCGNTKDEDCDGNVGKFVYQDQDGDRYAPNNISYCVNVVSFPGMITVGYELGTNDCNDNNASIHPGAPLNCNNGQDNDCSGNIEKWAYTDVDGDRYAPNNVSYCVDVVNFPGMITVGYELGTNDCNDTNFSINPSAPDDTCDSIDNNCNLYVDENAAPCFAPTSFGIYSWGLTYVSLSWTYPGPSSRVEKFVIQMSPNGITYVDVAEAPASATNYTIRTYLTSKYYFRVYAKNATGSGSPSSVTSAPIGVNSLFEKTIGGSGDDQAHSIIQSSDGGYVVAGQTSSFGAGGFGYDIYIVKLDSGGNVVWTKTIGGSSNDIAHSIIQSSDGGYVVAGWTSSFGAGGADFYIVKLDSGGNVQWTKTIGGSSWDEAYSIIQSSDGGYVVAGRTSSFGAGSVDFYVVKLDSGGNVQWTKTIGGSFNDEAYSIIQSSDGGYAVAGRTSSFGAGDYDFYVVKLAPDGTLGCHDSFQSPSTNSGGVEASPTPPSSYVSPLSSFVSPVSYSLATTDIALCIPTFAERIGGSSDDFAYSIIQSSDGGYVVAGYTLSFGAGDYDMYVVKLYSDGSIQWTKTMGGSLTDEARSIIQSSDGGFAVAGNTQSFGAGGADIYVVKLDSGGNVLWTKTIGGSADDEARSIIQSSDGGFVVAGWTQSFGAGGYDMYIVKIDGSGNVAWTKTIGGTGNDYAYSIIQDLDRNYVVVGWSNSFGSNNDIYVVKLDSAGNVVWTKTIGGSGDDGANSIIQSSDGAYVIAGHTNSFSSSYDFYVVKIDSSGNVLWTKTIGGGSYDQALSIIQSSDGGYIVVGRTQSFGAGNYDVYVVKLDSSGNVLWTKTIGGGSADEARSITQSSDGGFAIAGYTQSFGAGSYDIYVVKTGPLGDTCWSQGITNYVVSSGDSSSPQSPVVSPQSPTVTSVSPASGSGGSVSSVCFSAGAPPVPMCLISGGCDYYQAGSDMEKITGTMKGVEREREQSEVKSYGCSVGGVYKYFILTVMLLLYSWFRFRRKKKAKSSCFHLF